MEEYYYDSSLTGEELDTALRQIPQVAACAEAAQAARTAAESWARGGTGTRDDEETDNAKTYAERAKASADAAAGSAASAKGSADTADEKLKLADKAAGDAVASATAARNSEDAARASQEAAASSETNAETSAGQAAKSASAAQQSAGDADASKQAAENWAKLSKSWAIGEGAPEQHPGEETDNAKYYAGQAKGSAESAAGSVQVIAENAEALQTVLDNLAAIQGAAGNAERAEAAADSADGAAERAEAAAKNAQSIAQGQLGYFETPEALQAQHEQGEAGQWAIVGTTDTIWVWDTDDGAWEDSGNKTDLSNYDTKEETDEKLAALKKELLLAAHPVGSYYWSSNATSPQTLFGGTWVEVKGLYLRARDDDHPAGTQFGADKHRHATSYGVSNTKLRMGIINEFGLVQASAYAESTAANLLYGVDQNWAVYKTDDIFLYQTSREETFPKTVSCYVWRRTA